MGRQIPGQRATYDVCSLFMANSWIALLGKSHMPRSKLLFPLSSLNFDSSQGGSKITSFPKNLGTKSLEA